jgi:hypothetical protein
MVFNMRHSGNIVKAVCGDLSIGTLVSKTVDMTADQTNL